MNYSLKIVEPIAITDSMISLTGTTPVTNVPEADYPVWSSTTTYALAARIINTTTHKIYESLQATNLNRNPLSEPLWWIEVSPTNRWAIFDTSVSTTTNQANNITYKLIPAQIVDTIGVLNLTDATDINITVYSPSAGRVVYTKSIEVGILPLTPSWWDWFFGIRRRKTQDIQIDLPPYGDAVITLEIIGGADLSVGVLIMGQLKEFGIGISHGAKVGIQDYSRKETNEFGDTVLVRRAFTKRANVDLLLNSTEVDNFQFYLSDIRAKPCLWICSNDYEALTIFGFYKNFDILISYALHSECSLELEGLS